MGIRGFFLMRQHAKQCDGKQRHPSIGKAEAHLRSLGKGAAGMHAYPCKYCKHWHVGHVGKKKAKNP